MYFLSAYYLLILCSFLLTYKGFGGFERETTILNLSYLDITVNECWMLIFLFIWKYYICIGI
jgi:hypothetical protein